MEIVTIPVVRVDQYYFYMHQAIKVWLFQKIIFDNYLDYHWASLSLHFYLVLKLLVSYKGR